MFCVCGSVKIIQPNLCAQGAKRTEAPKLQSGTRWEKAVTNSKNNCGRGMEEKRGAVDERQKG